MSHDKHYALRRALMMPHWDYREYRQLQRWLSATTATWKPILASSCLFALLVRRDRTEAPWWNRTPSTLLLVRRYRSRRAGRFDLGFEFQVFEFLKMSLNIMMSTHVEIQQLLNQFTIALTNRLRLASITPLAVGWSLLPNVWYRDMMLRMR